MYKKISYLGIAVLAAVVIINLAFYWEVEFETPNPIIEMEFVRTVTGMDAISFQGEKLNESLVGAVKHGIWFDYPYALLYALFSAMLFIKIAFEEKKGIFKLGAVLGLVAFFSGLSGKCTII